MTTGGFVSMLGNKIYNNQADSSHGGGTYITNHDNVEVVSNKIFSNTA